jgi:hypothetical protein
MTILQFFRKLKPFLGGQPFPRVRAIEGSNIAPQLRYFILRGKWNK